MRKNSKHCKTGFCMRFLEAEGDSYQSCYGYSYTSKVTIIELAFVDWNINFNFDL